jgi:hypothetical protein
MNEVESALKHIEVLANSLNQKSDLLSQKIVEIESALNQYKLGIWAWLDEPLLYRMESDGNGHDFEVAHVLGYGKIRDKWGILLHERPDFDPETIDPIFLKDAPRDIRICAVDRIPTLIERIAEKAAELSQQITEKTKVAERIAASLKK